VTPSRSASISASSIFTALAWTLCILSHQSNARPGEKLQDICSSPL
jgi:hypothetical protein